jgi:predicted DNA-binding protein YlxM (UPF0122 family)
MKKYKDRDWLRDNYLFKNKSLQDIANECDVSIGAVKKFTDKYHFKKEIYSYKNKNWLEKQYIENKKSSLEIAKQCNVSKQTIQFYLKLYNIPIRSLKEATKLKFEKKYSLPSDYELYYRKGYAFIKLPEGNNKPYHVWLMEQHLKRKLLQHERIHHIDGNKLNNELNNLFLCKNISEHRTLHYEIEKVAFKLIERNIIYFDKKEKIYKISENLLNDTDNQQG